jgi:hypothetical protein
MTIGGLRKGWYADADEPGLSRYWDGTRWSGVRRTMHPAPVTFTTVSLSRLQRFWYGHVVRLPGVLTALSWSNRTVPGLRGRLRGATRPTQLRDPERGDGP